MCREIKVPFSYNNIPMKCPISCTSNLHISIYIYTAFFKKLRQKRILFKKNNDESFGVRKNECIDCRSKFVLKVTVALETGW